MKTVLMSGATGLVGSKLKAMLLKSGRFNVKTISHKEMAGDYHWNWETGTITPHALSGITHIVHLAGEGVVSKPWSKNQKERIVRSRIDTLRMLYELARMEGNTLECVVSASASGYYGTQPKDTPHVESDPPGADFLSQCCVQWEEAASQFNSLGVRYLSLRTPIVLAQNGGALSSMLKPFRAGIGSALGSGKQVMTWVHVDDLCSAYIHALETDTMHGVFNVSSPGYVSNLTFSKTLAQVLNKRLFPFSVPGFALRIALGKRANLLLCGNAIDSSKLEQAGFSFQYKELLPCLENLLIE